ncbi:MAG: dermonecrotic toxin domain-containing protein [Pseudomonas sp.]
MALVALDLIGLFKAWSLPQESWSQAFSDAHVHIVDQLPQGGLFGELDDYLVYQGLFRKTEPMQYTRETQVITDLQAFQQFIWELDIHDAFIAQLDDYWLHQFDDFAMLARVNFIAACNKQVEEGSLSQAGCQLAWRSAGIAIDDDTPTAPDSLVEARMLNFYGYVASDIPCLTDRVSGLTLLYIPGHSSPLHEFENLGAMKTWLVEQCKDAEKCKALMAHFRLEDLQNGLSYSGLQATLEGLANYHGTRYLNIDNVIIPARGWSTAYINYKVDEYSPVIAGSLFNHIALRQKQRSYEDAQFLITTNSDVIKAKWRG